MCKVEKPRKKFITVSTPSVQHYRCGESYCLEGEWWILESVRYLEEEVVNLRFIHRKDKREEKRRFRQTWCVDQVIREMHMMSKEDRQEVYVEIERRLCAS
jgi:hypothetical protein